MNANDRGQALDLLDALNRVLAEWTNPRFVERTGRAAGLDLDSSAIYVLTLIGRHGPLRPSIIAERMVTGASNVSKILARLEGAGLVERTPDPDDARATLTQVTDAGRAASTSLDDAGVLTLERMLTGWNAGERRRFVESMRRFKESTVREISEGDGPGA